MTENEAIKWLKAWSATHQNENDNVRESVWSAIQALEEIQAYRAIGTIEELQALKEKLKPKKPLKIKTDEKILYMCPSCKKVFIEAYDTVQRGHIPRHCEICGQNIKWCWGQ